MLPLLGLLALALFGVTRFSSHWIEAQAHQNIVASLDDAGYSWAELTISGQQARLSGSVPSIAAGGAAVQVARDATCPTWLGPKVCAISVTSDFDSADESAAQMSEPEEESAAPIAPTDEAQTCERDLAALVANDRIEFASGSATIVASTAPLLDRIADVAGGCPGILRVEGHTDSTGNPDANQALSSARAEAVRTALGSRGVSLDRITAVGYGQTVPIASNDTSAGRARNRRIDFRVLVGAN